MVFQDPFSLYPKAEQSGYFSAIFWSNPGTDIGSVVSIASPFSGIRRRTGWSGCIVVLFSAGKSWSGPEWADLDIIDQTDSTNYI